MGIVFLLYLIYWVTAGTAFYALAAALAEARMVTLPLLWLAWMACFVVGRTALRQSLKIPALQRRYLELPEKNLPVSRLTDLELLVAHFLVGLLFQACALIPGFVGGR